MKEIKKMKTPLLRILKLISLLTVSAVNSAELNLAEDDMWSLDGGVFYPASQGVPTGDELSGQLLIKDSKGFIRIAELPGTAAEIQSTTILVDRQAPIISASWQNAIESDSEVIIGPNSVLTLSVDEAELSEITFDDKPQPIAGLTFTHQFTKPVSTIKVKTQDPFNNSRQMMISPKLDYQSPKVSWDLVTPAIKTNGVWYAGDSAGLKLQATDQSGLGQVTLKGQQVVWQDTVLNLQPGAEIQVSDQLGNIHNENIHWEVDSVKPEIRVSVEGQPVTMNKRMVVKVNELIEVAMTDEGVGLKEQKYKGKSRTWRSLPKKFRFTSKGNYRVEVYAVDAVGNQLETYIKFKVKR